MCIIALRVPSPLHCILGGEVPLLYFGYVRAVAQRVAQLPEHLCEKPRSNTIRHDTISHMLYSGSATGRSGIRAGSDHLRP